MNCNFCESPATVFLTQVIDNQLKKICICEACSQDKELMQENGLDQIFTTDAIAPAIPTPEIKEMTDEITSLKCECGFTLENFSQTGRLGCSKCYTTFKSLIDERLDSLHKGVTHTGKKIDLPLTKESLTKKISSLQDALKVAVMDENFEQAAKLRDQLTTVETEFERL